MRRFAHQSHTDLHVAQQEIVLLYALDLLRERAILPRLAFKGGTYLRKMILGQQGRFSEDLDLTAVRIARSPEALFRAAFQRAHHGVHFDLEGAYRTERGWASRVSYKHEWDKGQFKLEVSYREKPSLPLEERVPLDQLYARDLPFAMPSIQCLQMAEALAEKLRATQQRATERDLYDVIQYSKTKFKPEVVRLVTTAKLWNDHEPFDARQLLATLSSGRKDWRGLLNLVGRKDETDWNAESQKAAARFDFLRNPTAFERRLIADHRRHALAKDLRAEIDRATG